MSNFFKRSAIAIAVLGLAGSAYAGTVTGAFFGGEGLDLQPRNGDLDFVTVLPSTGTVATYGIHPSYAWGWRLYGGFTFCGNEDLTVSWTRFRTSDTNDFGTPVGPTGSAIPTVVRWLPGTTFSLIFGDADFHLDDVYGVFGHTINMGPWSVRFAGGVEWARLNAEMEAIANTSTLVVGYEDHSHMHGFGPRVEFDFTYHLPYNLSVFARTNLALLIASRQIYLDSVVTDTTDALSTDFDWSIRRVVVPHVGIKLGVGYNFLFGDMGGEGSGCGGVSALTVEAGWQTDSYIHAIERPEGFENTSGAGAGSRSNLTTRASNFGVEGLFVGAKLSTNWL